jgi:hypothetical protein
MQNFWDSLKAFWDKLSPAWKLWLDRIAAGFIAAVMTAIVTTIMVRLGIQPAVIPPPPPDPIIVQHRATGYIKDPEAVKEAVASIEATQGVSVEFAKSAQQLLQGPDDDASAFMWDDEVKVYGDVKPSLDQGWVGSCTSQSTARCIQDILIGQVADGLSEKPPADVDSMTLYGGMRVNLGKGRFRGDGGINMWVFEYAQKYGVCFKQKYGDYDLSKYTPELAKKYGRDGVPPALLEVAKQHPVKTVARVSNANELWRALGSYYPLAIAIKQKANNLVELAAKVTKMASLAKAMARAMPRLRHQHLQLLRSNGGTK